MKVTKSYLIFILFTLSFLLFAACSDDKEIIEEPEPEEKEKTEYKVSISASKQRLNLFEETKISFDRSHWIEIDSVISEIDNILYDKSGDGSWLISMEQSFMLPGTYLGISNAYVADELVASDSIEIEVEDRGDFLGYRWGVENEDRYGFRSTQKDNEFWVIPKFYDMPYPHIILRYIPYRASDEEQERQTSVRPFFYNYITTLYGENILEYEEEDISKIPNLLIEEYSKRFKTPLKSYDQESAYPLVFWETFNTNIVLVGYIHDEHSDPNDFLLRRFEVKAEPKW